MLVEQIDPRVKNVDSTIIDATFAIHLLIHDTDLLLEICVLLLDVLDHFVFLLNNRAEIVRSVIANVLLKLFT